jgi:hypothetical protein
MAQSRTSLEYCGRIWCGIALLTCLIAPACSRNKSSIPERADEGTYGLSGTPAAPFATEAIVAGQAQSPRPVSRQGAPVSPPPPQSPLPAASNNRKIIRHGNQTIEVPRIDAALDTIRRTVTELGGYTTDESHRQQNDGMNTATITCRVPAEKLDDAIGRFQRLGKQEQLSITAEDISESYSDLEIQIGNQKRLEARLLDLLNRQTNRLTDLLEIERETARVRGEIDRMEGRKRFWDNQLALSTLIVALHDPRPAIASAGGGPWRTLRQAFGDAGDNFVLTVADIIAAIGTLIPLIVTIAVVVLALRWLLRWRRAARVRARA